MANKDPFERLKVNISRAGDPIQNFGIPRDDPGFVYVVRNLDRYKVGRTLNPRTRLTQARTWLPDVEIVGIKPFWQHKAAEFCLHLGLSRSWHAREWFIPLDEGYVDILEAEFRAFSDTDIDRNSIDFVYLMNGSGMSEFVMEFESEALSKSAFLRGESGK